MCLWGACAVALAMFGSGCGSECGPGTTEHDGQCVAEADGCGPDTVLEDGQCVLADRNCGEGTALDPDTGECVPAETVCDRGTTFDHVRRTCVRSTEVFCGAGTELDAETGECVVSEDLCGRDADFDPGSGRCVGRVCADDQGRVDGVCVGEAEQLAEHPDYVERENNDPDLGGQADRFYLKPVDGGPLVFTGAITEPEDRDGDGELDQDVDVFEFEVDEGAWLEVAVQSLGMPAPAFKIEGPDGFVRYSPISRGAHAAREVVIPRAGVYRLTVLPEIVLHTDGDINLLGDDQWGYVGTVAQVSAPEPTSLDVSSGSVSFEGDVMSLTDNLYEFDGAEIDDLFQLVADVLGEDAEIVVQIWQGDQLLEHALTADQANQWWLAVPDAANTQVLIDWVRLEGARTEYDFSARLSGKGRYVTMPANYYQTLAVPAVSRDTINASVLYVGEAPGDGSFDARISDAAGGVLAEESGPLDAPPVQATVWADETYQTRFLNRTDREAHVLLMARVIPPVDLGHLADDVVEESSPGQVTLGDSAAYTFEVSADRYVEFVHDNATGQPAHVEVFNSDGDILYQKDSLSAVQGTEQTDRTPFWYAAEPDEVLVVLGFDAEIDEHFISARSATATDIGLLEPTGVISVSSSTPVERGFSEFRLFHTGEPVAVAATFSVSGFAPSLCSLYSDVHSEIGAGESSHAEPCQAAAMLAANEVYLARLTAASDDFSGYNASLVGVPLSEAWGSLASDSSTSSSPLESVVPGQTYSVSMSVQEGQVLEISHSNDGNHPANLRVFDENGLELLSHAGFEANQQSSYSRSYEYWYVDQSETLTVELEGDSVVLENEVLTVASRSVPDLGTLMPGDTVSHSSAQLLQRGRHAYHKVSLDSTSWIEADVFGELPSTDVDLAIYDVRMNPQHSVDSFEGVEQPKIRLDAGDYLFAVEAGETTASYDLTVTRADAPDYVSSPAATIPTNSYASDTLAVSGCASIDAVEVYVDISYLGIHDLSVSVEAPSGEVVALHNRTGAYNESDIRGWYPIDLNPSEPLGALVGTSGDGMWTLMVRNHHYGSVGTFNHWAMELSCS